MAQLPPSQLETTPTGTVNWNDILTTNMQRINDKLGHLMSADQVPGTPTVDDPENQTQEELTDSTTGIASNTINDVGTSFSQTTLNNNFASITEEIENIRVDVAELNDKVTELLEALRKSSGVGVLGS